MENQTQKAPMACVILITEDNQFIRNVPVEASSPMPDVLTLGTRAFLRETDRLYREGVSVAVQAPAPCNQLVG